MEKPLVDKPLLSGCHILVTPHNFQPIVSVVDDAICIAEWGV